MEEQYHVFSSDNGSSIEDEDDVQISDSDDDETQFSESDTVPYELEEESQGDQAVNESQGEQIIQLQTFFVLLVFELSLLFRICDTDRNYILHAP